MKSQFKMFLLTLLFGPFGLFYCSALLGLLLSALVFLLIAIAWPLAIALWPISIFVGIFAVKRHNSRLSPKTQRVVTIPRSETPEEQLADFRISSPLEQPKRSRKEAQNSAKWVQPGQEVKVGKLSIPGGLFYVDRHLNQFDSLYMGNDCSLIDPTLKTDFKSPDYVGNQMTYWPSYSQISPQSRAAYLEWLASDRSDPETYIGYVFLYFYGIERRLLVDDLNGGISDGERRELIKELKRLKSIYGQNRSFDSYAGSLLSHVWAINQDDSPLKPEPNILVAKRGFTSGFRLLLARTVQEGKPVSGELALAWVNSHPDLTLRTPARRCPDEFDALFMMRYRSSFGDGIKITPNKIRLQLDYVPASASLIGYPSTKLDLPDVSHLKRPFRRLHTLAEACTTELEQFSRYVGKQGNSRGSLRALSLLPNDLIPSLSNPLLESLKNWMGTQISESGGLVPVESIFRYAGEGIPPKINKREAEMLARVAEMAGFGVAPDIRFHQAKPDIYGKAVLFAGGHGNSFSPSSEFRKVGTIIRLGSLVAAIDEHISESEVNALESIVSNDRHLAEKEKHSLRAYMMWRLHSPPNIVGLKKRLEHFTTREKVAISHILVGVALADGKIEPAEINQLEKLYSRLGLDKAMVTSDIHSLSISRLPRSSQEREIATTVPTEDQPKPDSGFSLDRNLIQLLERETEEAQSVLDSIFSEEDFDEAPEPGFSTDAPSASGAIQGLDAKFQELYSGLISKDEWSQEELEELCGRLQLMPEGAVETINDWAFDSVGAPLVENGSIVFVDLEIAEELSELQKQRQLV